MSVSSPIVQFSTVSNGSGAFSGLFTEATKKDPRRRAPKNKWYCIGQCGVLLITKRSKCLKCKEGLVNGFKITNMTISSMTISPRISVPYELSTTSLIRPSDWKDE